MPPGIAFEFDNQKAIANLKKHGVTFEEAITIFHDRSPRRCRMISIPRVSSVSSPLACHHFAAFCLSFTLSVAPAPGLSVRVSLLPGSEISMKKPIESDPLAERPELDFRTGVRGKHLERMRQGTNVAVIAPDLIETFPNSEAVNEALRSLKQIADRMRRRAS